jgi:predicted Zn-dependent protease
MKARKATFMRKLAILVATSLTLTACQLVGGGAPARVDPVAVTPQRLPSGVEEAIGARENPRVVAEYGGVYIDADLEAALVDVVTRIVAASDDPSRQYRVTILNSPVANAFALPGGYLYVTRGLLALSDDNSELAAVLSHEIAHVIANHALERAKVVEQADIVARVASDVLSDPIARDAATVSSQMTLAKFSRNQEVAADRIGIMVAGRAGYDPFAASRFLKKLEGYAAFRSAIGADDDAANFLASHPAALERRDLAIRTARQFGAPGIGETGRDAYLGSLDGMVYGDDPSEGFVRGRQFLHPRLSISFTVPSRYRLENTREAVLAAAGRDTAMRFDGVSVRANVSPADYLSSGWINGLERGTIRSIATGGGLPAAVASAAAGGWVFKIGAIRVGPTLYRLIFADRRGGDALEAALNETLATFRRLDPVEVARLRPLRIDIITVKNGDTLASLAARMRGTERRLELFRLLNGLDRKSSLVPGRKVKIVVD